MKSGFKWLYAILSAGLKGLGSVRSYMQARVIPDLIWDLDRVNSVVQQVSNLGSIFMRDVVSQRGMTYEFLYV